jgi:CheY-like chemotaxis protein
VLQRLRSDPSHNSVPVVILSDSDEQRYREESYRNGANSFIQKPSTLEATRDKIGTFFHYWLDVVGV